ncbi:polyisoprenoid diphosphate/phosphate phosphohydrolase PLPP6-like isoform X1 [Alosa alosa]|uniref:polyisoprenoid diphosphate/phosphate phosphohydrolase PLPP6-like isoform X1 n=1 Tax=Alosa alosa TaxID=278164 RepID=UPI0020154214|nr:polyisoprenoid diphosphate/phosphate phosphohydrolase PLPP6-like isoform X1 [Alosa alosa]
MPSPKARRNGNRSGSISGIFGSSVSGRFEFGPVHPRRSSDYSSRRRASSFSSASVFGNGAQSQENPKRLNLSFITIAFRFLLAIDLWLSKRLGVCTCEDSLLGSIRPLVKLVEVSGHGVPWLISAVYGLVYSDSAAELETMLNLLMALVLDMALVGIVKAIVRRRPPSHSRSDLFMPFAVDRYCFPSGHATRASMCACFLLTRLVSAGPLRALLLAWAGLVGLSRVLLGQSNVTDVLFGLCLGYCHYGLVDRLWLSPERLQDILTTFLRDSLAGV